jgi:hypothetical protein
VSLYFWVISGRIIDKEIEFDNEEYWKGKKIFESNRNIKIEVKTKSCRA